MYLNEEQKREVEKHGPRTTNELSFCLFKVVAFYLANKGVSYRSFAEVVGALELTKNEFTRRAVNPLEDARLQKNGDLFNIAPPVSSSTILTPQ